MAALHQGFCWHSYVDYTWYYKPSLYTSNYYIQSSFIGFGQMYHKSNSLNIKKQYPKKWRQGPTDNTGTETPACLQKNHTRDKTNWRLKAATSQLLLHRNDRSRKVSTHVKIMEKIFTCLYASTNDIYVAVLTQGIFITLLLRKDQSQNAFRLEVYAVLATIIRMRHSLFKKVKLN